MAGKDYSVENCPNRHKDLRSRGNTFYCYLSWHSDEKNEEPGYNSCDFKGNNYKECARLIEFVNKKTRRIKR